jgi:DNA-directed RNA polymerase specialized sigma24 family protein
MSTLLSTCVRVTDRQAITPAGPLFRRVYARHFCFVRQALYKHGVADRDLDDEANETFIIFARILAREGPRYDERRGPGMLYAIAIHRTGNYRTSVRRRREFLAGDLFADGPDLPSHTASPETVLSLKEALARLEPPLMPATYLLLEGFSIREIGHALPHPHGHGVIKDLEEPA